MLPVVATGRCWFGPLKMGTVLDRIASRAASGWQVTGRCRLVVEEIGFYGALIDQLDQTHSARLVLAGRPSAAMQPGSLLIGVAESECRV